MTPSDAQLLKPGDWIIFTASNGEEYHGYILTPRGGDMRIQWDDGITTPPETTNFWSRVERHPDYPATENQDV